MTFQPYYMCELSGTMSLTDTGGGPEAGVRNWTLGTM